MGGPGGTVEGPCTEAEWKQATEINEMEENFRHFGTVMAKFWVHADQEEQLRRFQALLSKPCKQCSSTRRIGGTGKMEALRGCGQRNVLRTHVSQVALDLDRGELQTLARIKALDVVIAAIERELLINRDKLSRLSVATIENGLANRPSQRFVRFVSDFEGIVEWG